MYLNFVFRWEKAQIEPHEARSQDSGIGLCSDRTGPLLQVSEECRELRVSPEETVLISSNQLLSSSSSSNEDLTDIELNFADLADATAFPQSEFAFSTFYFSPRSSLIFFERNSLLWHADESRLLFLGKNKI